MGRLSLNPLRHIDRFGTIILPGLLLISQLADHPPRRLHVRLGEAGAGGREALPPIRAGA